VETVTARPHGVTERAILPVPSSMKRGLDGRGRPALTVSPCNAWSDLTRFLAVMSPRVQSHLPWHDPLHTRPACRSSFVSAINGRAGFGHTVCG